MRLIQDCQEAADHNGLFLIKMIAHPMHASKVIRTGLTSLTAVMLMWIATGCERGEISRTADSSGVLDPDTIVRGPNQQLPEVRAEPTLVLSSLGYPVQSNGSRSDSDTGPQSIDRGDLNNYPGLRYGDYLLKNNAWNQQNTIYGDWYQTIELEDNGESIVAKVDWDLGRPDQLTSFYDVTSYPEIIYGTKSSGEISADFSESGLPVRVSESPDWEVDYAYRMRLSASGADSSSQATPQAEYNVAIESFWHSDCDIRRAANNRAGNQVFEMMVWLRTGERKPSGQAPVAQFYTSDGLEFDVYVKTEVYGYIAYVATSEKSSGTILYSEIIDDARINASVYGVYPLQPTDCMANILMGPELWFGAGTFYWDLFQVHRKFYD